METDGVGYSKSTIKKLEYLSVIFKYHLKITNAVLEKNDYFLQSYRYIDLTAGKGYIPDIGDGSPIIFIKSVKETNFKSPIFIDLIEKENKNIISLKKIIKSTGDFPSNIQPNCINYYESNYEDEVPRIIKNKSKEFGLIYVDPTGQLPSLDTLRYIAENRPLMEILIYISATNIKRQQHYIEIELIDFTKQVKKESWLIRSPQKSDKFQFTFLMGSNAKKLFREYKQISFYPIDSKNGKDIVNRLNLTKANYQKKIQPKLTNF